MLIVTCECVRVEQISLKLFLFCSFDFENEVEKWIGTFVGDLARNHIH